VKRETKSLSMSYAIPFIYWIYLFIYQWKLFYMCKLDSLSVVFTSEVAQLCYGKVFQ